MLDTFQKEIDTGTRKEFMGDFKKHFRNYVTLSVTIEWKTVPGVIVPTDRDMTWTDLWKTDMGVVMWDYLFKDDVMAWSRTPQTMWMTRICTRFWLLVCHTCVTLYIHTYVYVYIHIHIHTHIKYGYSHTSIHTHTVFTVYRKFRLSDNFHLRFFWSNEELIRF